MTPDLRAPDLRAPARRAPARRLLSRIAPALIATTLLAPPAGALGVLDAPWRTYDAGVFPNIGPIALAMGDLDGDGDLDAVTGLDYFGGPGITVLLARGDGSFGDPVIYDTGFNNSVGDVALADVSGDGRLDVVASVPDTFGQGSTIRLYRNQGDGSLAAPQTFTTGPGPEGVALGDLNGDARPDVVVANADRFDLGDTLSVLLHNGLDGADAGFLPKTDYFAGQAVAKLALGDLDGDGDLDVVVGRETGALRDRGEAVLLNDGSGGLGAPTFHDALPSAGLRDGAPSLADFDGDGDLDIVGAGATNGVPSFGQVGILPNRGDATFGPPIELRLADWTFSVDSTAVADLNGDGIPDIVASTPSGRALDGFNVLLSDGVGSFRPAAFRTAAKQTRDLELVDADGDGLPDVVTVAQDSAAVTVHVNPGDGVFPQPTRYDVGTLTGLATLMHGNETADLDGDGDLDVVTVDSDVRVLRNRGDATFDAAELVSLPIGGGSVRLPDLDGDGDPDILVGPDPNEPPYDFAVVINRGDGTFEAAVLIPVGASQGGDIEALDIDGDGLLDVALADPGPASAIHLARNLGDGTSFALQPRLETSGLPFGVGTSDFDGDGNADIVSETALGLTVYFGDGAFGFSEMGLGEPGYPFDVVDLDLDGDDDLVYDAGELTTDTNWAGVIRNFGDGGFAFPFEIPGPIGLESAFTVVSDVDAADVTGDGLPDVIFTSNAPNDLSVFRGLGDGTLEAHRRYGAGYSASDTAAGDLDGDGAIDLAIVISLPPSGLGNAVVVLAGTVSAGDLLDLTVVGACPGPLTLEVTGAAPQSRVGFLGARSAGASEVPGGAPCAGTGLGLASPLRALGLGTADGDGVAVLSFDAPAGACGAVAQAIDLTTCKVSDVGGL